MPRTPARCSTTPISGSWNCCSRYAAGWHVATSRRRVELQLAQLQQSAAKLHGQAQRAAVTSQIGDLQGQQASLWAEQDKLTVASQRLQAQVKAFRTRKETIKAAYTAAEAQTRIREAQTRIREAVTGISEELGDLGLAIQRAPTCRPVWSPHASREVRPR